MNGYRQGKMKNPWRYRYTHLKKEKIEDVDCQESVQDL